MESKEKKITVPEIIKGYYISEIKLGGGSYGVVYKSKCLTTNISYAIKIIKSPKTNEDKKDLNREIDVAMSIKNKYLVKLCDSFRKEDDYYYLVFEYCNKNSLRAFLEENKKYFGNENFAVKVMKNVLTGYDALADQKVLHRDIKPDNIFVCEDDKILSFKLGDYGFSKKEDESFSFKGTGAFMAPEMKNGGPYDHKIDIYSIGLVFYYILFGDLPKIKDGIISLDLTKVCISSDARNFLQGCLMYNPKDRMNITEAKNHPLILREIFSGNIIEFSIQ